MKSVQQSKRVKERFDVELGGITQGISIITDNKTGVQYLAVNNSGISVIVDKEGKPLLTDVENQTPLD